MKIFIDYDKLPEVLKTIIISLYKCEDIEHKTWSMEQDKVNFCENPTNFSFLLRVNSEKTEYSATIISPYEAGIYPLAVSILDFQHQQLKELSGKLLLRQQLVPTEDYKGNIWGIIGRIMIITGLLVLAGGIGFLIWRLLARKK